MEIHQHISKWGNSLGLRIPNAMAESLGIKQGDDVSITVENHKMVITPAKRSFSLSHLPAFDVEAACAGYANCDPLPDNVEAFLTMPAVGREIK